MRTFKLVKVMTDNIAPIRKSMNWTHTLGVGNAGGGPPGDDELKERVEKLEAAMPEIQARLVRIETKLEDVVTHIATKAELAAVGTMIAELRTSVSETILSQTKWYIATAVVLAGLAFTAARLVI